MANLKFLRYKTTSEFNTAKTNKSFKQGDIVFDSEAKILYIVTDNTPTLEPYYGNNAIKDVSCNNSEITATLSDGSTKKITVNNVVNAANANKTQAALTFGSQTFDGSSAKTITAADLGLSSALKFLGTTTTALTDGATTNPITINGANVTAQIGNVVLYNHLEFIWNGSKWEELGDEQSFALKSVQINAGNGLTGGGTLEATRTISHADTSSQASMTTGGRTYINSITLDGYGHVTGLGTGTESNQTDISGNAATATILKTSQKINGTSFNGSADITTANWGTARDITITDDTNTGAAVSVNGSAAVSLKLPTTISANFKGGTISGTTGTFSSSLSVTGDIAASSNVNVTNQTKSKTFSIDGGCTLEYDSTNKCVKFVF